MRDEDGDVDRPYCSDHRDVSTAPNPTFDDFVQRLLLEGTAHYIQYIGD